MRRRPRRPRPIERADAAGDTARALFAAGLLARLLFASGRFSEVPPCLERGATYVDRLGDLSNPVLQFLGASAMIDRDRPERPEFG